MREKSKKLYAILVLEKDEMRDKSLSKILDVKYNGQLSENSNFICGTTSHPTYTKNLSYIKVWKTLSGATRFFNRVKEEARTISTLLNRSYKVQEIGSIGLELVEITELWNSDINKRIEKETLSYQKRIERLKQLKIE